MNICKIFTPENTVDEIDHEEMKSMKKELDHLNCNKATNAEICHLVASFFTVLGLYSPKKCACCYLEKTF